MTINSMMVFTDELSVQPIPAAYDYIAGFIIAIAATMSTMIPTINFILVGRQDYDTSRKYED